MSRLNNSGHLSKISHNTQSLSSFNRLTYNDPEGYLYNDLNYSSDIDNMKENNFQKKMRDLYFLTEGIKVQISMKLLEYFENFCSLIYDMKEDETFFVSVSRGTLLKLHSLDFLISSDLISEKEYNTQKRTPRNHFLKLS